MLHRAERWLLTSWWVIMIACLASRGAGVEIEVGYTEALPGQDTVIDVILRSDTEQVVGTQNDIAFGPEAQIAVNANGDPDCWANPAIDKSATAFAFFPPGCFPSPIHFVCNAIRSLVIALNGLAPIADGQILYSCRVILSMNAAAAERRLLCFNASSSDPNGHALATFCHDGGILPPGATPGPTRTPAPEPPRLAGEPCERNDECAFGVCTDGACCVASCGDDETCVFGSDCLPRCETDSDCGPHGLCFRRACYVVSSTPYKPAGDKPAGGPFTNSPPAQAGGGCFIAQPADEPPWSLLVALPFLLMRRRRRAFLPRWYGRTAYLGCAVPDGTSDGNGRSFPSSAGTGH